MAQDFESSQIKTDFESLEHWEKDWTKQFASDASAIAVQKYNSAISAEHGVGMTKKPYLHYTRSEEEIACLRAIQQVFDLNQVLNLSFLKRKLPLPF